MKKINFQALSQLQDELSSIDVQALLMNRAKNAVLTTAVELMEQDMLRLCGVAFARKGEGLCHRGGSDQTSLMVDGAKLSVGRPRARKNGEEVEICRSCWRNQKFCSPECSRQAFLERRRQAQKLYNDTEAGRRSHRERQKTYRLRQKDRD